MAGGDQIQALVKVEAARVALEQQKIGRSTQSPAPTRGEAGNAKKQHVSDAHEFKGLRLSRQPNPYEAASIVQIHNAQETAIARLTAAVLATKDELLQRALFNLANEADFSQMTLTEAQAAQFVEKIEGAIFAGKQSIVAELLNSNKRDTPETSPDISKPVKRFYEALVSALTTNLSTRIQQAVTFFRLRNLATNDVAKKVAQELERESIASYQQIAAGVALTAVNYGRKMEAETRGYKRVIYSAILDANQCVRCKEADGKEGVTGDDLPAVPNMDCLGRWRCRCVWVYVFEEA